MTKKKTIPEGFLPLLRFEQSLHQDDVYYVSTEYDESDDIEATKKTVSEKLQEELEPIPDGSLKEKILEGPEITELARKQRGLQTD
jgi:hypothetical protein